MEARCRNMSRDRRRKSGQVIDRAEKRVRLVANGLIPSAEPGDKWAAYSPTAAEVDEWRRNKSLIARLASHAGVPVWAVPALIRCSKRSRRGRVQRGCRLGTSRMDGPLS